MSKLYKTLLDNDENQNVDMTPLIDMVFILLIFFIVTTVFVKDKGMDIERPSQRSTGQVQKESLLIAIKPDGTIRAGGQNLSINSLRAWVTSRLAKQDIPVVLLADKHVAVGLLAEVMDECRLAGAKGISLATEDKE